jgi:poly(3-hydroxybutyrate) depolymerase
MKAKCENCKWFFVSYYGLSDGGKMIDDMLCLYNPPVAGIGKIGRAHV